MWDLKSVVLSREKITWIWGSLQNENLSCSKVRNSCWRKCLFLLLYFQFSFLRHRCIQMLMHTLKVVTQKWILTLIRLRFVQLLSERFSWLLRLWYVNFYLLKGDIKSLFLFLSRNTSAECTKFTAHFSIRKAECTAMLLIHYISMDIGGSRVYIRSEFSTKLNFWNFSVNTGCNYDGHSIPSSHNNDVYTAYTITIFYELLHVYCGLYGVSMLWKCAKVSFLIIMSVNGSKYVSIQWNGHVVHVADFSFQRIFFQ